MDSPLISVIVPVYKVENYISRCIDSIIAQTYTNFELLLVNDGSPDNSEKICQEYTRKDSRIHLFNKENGGVSSARNLGINNAKGKFLCFIDSDDSVTPNYISDLYHDNLNAEQPCLVMHKYIVDNLTLDFNNRILNENTAAGNDVYQLVISEKLVRFSAPYSKLFSTYVIQLNKIEFPLGVHMGEDAIFMIRYLCFANSIVTSNKCNYLIYRREDSLMQTYNPFESEFLGYQLWKSSFIQFQKKYQTSIDQQDQKTLWENIEDPFIRSVQSVYKSKENLTLREQATSLKSIPKHDYELFIRYYEPSNLKNTVSKLLIKNRMFYLYCLLGKSTMRQ